MPTAPGAKKKEKQLHTYICMCQSLYSSMICFRYTLKLERRTVLYCIWQDCCEKKNAPAAVALRGEQQQQRSKASLMCDGGNTERILTACTCEIHTPAMMSKQLRHIHIYSWAHCCPGSPIIQTNTRKGRRPGLGWWEEGTPQYETSTNSIISSVFCWFSHVTSIVRGFRPRG